MTSTLKLFNPSDAALIALHQEGWIIKSPFFIGGLPVFPAFKRG